jgi:hypothetical protein
MKHIPRKPVANSKIIVDDQQTKEMIMDISAETGESMKSIIQRLVEIEHMKSYSRNKNK